MRNTAILILTIFFMIITIPQPGNSCTDVLEIFLSKEKVDDSFRTTLIEISKNISLTELHLHKNEKEEYSKELNRLVETWMKFYSNYANNPPAQWVNSKKWINKLGVITRKIAQLKKSKTMDYDKVHKVISSINDDLLEIFKSKSGMSEQTILNFISEKIREFDTLTDIEEKEMKFNNIKALAKLLKDYEPENLTDKDKTDYDLKRNKFLTEMDDIKTFTSGKNSLDINKFKMNFKNFTDYRTKLLRGKWF